MSFSSVTVTTPPHVCSTSHIPMDHIVIDSYGIQKIIESLKLSSSAGPDCINSKFLKNTSCYSSILLSMIFMQSLEQGLLPADWKIGKVVPLHKSGDTLSPLNYRPISLTSVPSKVFLVKRN